MPPSLRLLAYCHFCYPPTSMVCGPLDPRICPRLADGPSPGTLASIRLLETDSPAGALPGGMK